MKKTALAIALASLCGTAAAGEVEYGTYNDGTDYNHIYHNSTEYGGGQTYNDYSGAQAGQYAGVHNSPLTNTSTNTLSSSATGGSATGGSAYSGDVSNTVTNSSSATNSATNGSVTGTNSLTGNNSSVGPVSLTVNGMGEDTARALGQPDFTDASTRIVSNYEAPRYPAASAIAAPLTASNDTCMGSTSAAGQGMTFGFSVGGTWTDKDCVRRKDARLLHNMGDVYAARALMCQKVEIRDAYTTAGVSCWTGKKLTQHDIERMRLSRDLDKDRSQKTVARNTSPMAANGGWVR